MPDWAIWILVGLAFGVLEMATVSFFASLFALGSLVAAAMAVFTDNWPVQALAFAGASVLFMWLLRPTLVRLYAGEPTRTGVDRLIGKTATVIEQIDNLQGTGQIKVSGEVWSARSAERKVVSVGSVVTVVGIDGVKAIVKESPE